MPKPDDDATVTDGPVQVPPCIHSHERWKLVSTHYAHARIGIRSCAHCGWVDTEAAIEDAFALLKPASQTLAGLTENRGNIQQSDTAPARSIKG